MLIRSRLFVAHALAAVFITLLSASAQAQKPALTKSIDEPGRAPYLSYVVQPCQGAEICKIQFKAVPAGFRLAVTYVSVVYVPSGADDNLISLGQSPSNSMYLFLPAPVSVGLNRMTSSPITFYVEPGSAPEITVFNSAKGYYISGSITGYLVALD